MVLMVDQIWLYKFAKAITNDETIDIYNHGNHLRDFTYIDDIIEGTFKVFKKTTYFKF